VGAEAPTVRDLPGRHTTRRRCGDLQRRKAAGHPDRPRAPLHRTHPLDDSHRQPDGHVHAEAPDRFLPRLVRGAVLLGQPRHDRIACRRAEVGRGLRAPSRRRRPLRVHGMDPEQQDHGQAVRQLLGQGQALPRRDRVPAAPRHRQPLCVGGQPGHRPGHRWLLQRGLAVVGEQGSRDVLRARRRRRSPRATSTTARRRPTTTRSSTSRRRSS
jgi:hypothetical protein